MKLLMIDYSQDVSVTQIVTLTKTDASLVPERTVLTLAKSPISHFRNVGVDPCVHPLSMLNIIKLKSVIVPLFK